MIKFYFRAMEKCEETVSLEYSKENTNEEGSKVGGIRRKWKSLIVKSNPGPSEDLTQSGR